LKKFGTVILDLKEYLVLILLVVISLILIFANDNSQIRFMRAVAVTSFGTIQSGLSAIPNVFQLEKENKVLRENNIQLSNEIATLKEAKLENIRLGKLLSFKEKSGLDVLSVKIINKSLTQSRNTITLNAGEKDSIFINMPVITDEGLVGRIVTTSQNYSVAQILYNKDMRLTVKVQRSRVDGILTFDGTNNLILQNIQKNADVIPGDLVITSEYSNLFPPGIPVGTVSETGFLDNLFKKVIVNPSVNFQILEEVFVLKYTAGKEREELEKKFKNK